MKKFFAFDRILFTITALLVVTGIFTFLSASFSTFAEIDKFKGILFNQLVLGVGFGIILFFIMLVVPYERLKKISLLGYVVGLVLLALVFVPGIGASFGGAHRWLALGSFSFQPVEFMKYALIIYLAAWLSYSKNKIKNASSGIIPFMIIIGLVGALLLLQPDTDNFFILAATGTLLYFLAGAKWRDIALLILMGLVGLGVLIAVRPYILSRVQVFLNPASDSLGASYQVQQQLIAVGSGKITGRGFGQSVQKFRYLPEPLSDSIYAVMSEEFGFMGSVTIIILYLLFFFRGIWVAVRVHDMFGRLLIVGIVSIITFQSFFNIGSVLAVFPLGGLPLIFMSHGGTALALALGAMGLVLNVSRKRV